MPLIEAFLALALTMLSLASVATVGVEMVHRLLHFRGNDLRCMLKVFYEAELQKIVNSHFNLNELSEIVAKRDKVVAELIKNPLVRDDTIWLGKWFKDLTRLSTDEMLKRLQKTEVGEALRARSQAEIDALLDNAITKYDDFGNAASELFKRRAQFVSLVAGIIVAFLLNVDALLMFQSYLQDPTMRSAVIANADTISNNWEKVDQNVKSLATVEAATTEATTAAAPPAAEPPETDPVLLKVERAAKKKQAELDQLKPANPTPDTTSSDAEKKLTTIKTDLAALRTQLAEVQEGIPVPLGYRDSTAPMIILAAKTDDWTSKRDLLIWFLRVFASGLLIGLGGPFWFNIVRTIMNFRGRGPAPAVSASPAPTAAAADPKTGFHAAQAAESALAPPGPPSPPGPTGGSGTGALP